MRFLICRTDGIGDLIITLPVQKCILDRYPNAEVFWLAHPTTAPILDHFPGVSGILHRTTNSDIESIIRNVNPDILLNISHRDRKIVTIAKKVGVPIRIARPRGLGQLIFATHRIWTKRNGSGRHESQHALDFLRPLGWSNIKPEIPHLVLTKEEIKDGQADLQKIPSPRLGVIVKGSGSGAFPSKYWWGEMLNALKTVGWNPVVLSPLDESQLPSANIRGLMSRLAACDAVIGPSTGPVHIAAVMDKPTLCLMGRRKEHVDRFTPMGTRVEILQYPGKEDDLGTGMDRLPIENVLNTLEKFR